MINLQYNISDFLRSNEFKHSNGIFYKKVNQSYVEVKINANNNEIEVYAHKRRIAYRSVDLEWVSNRAKKLISDIIDLLNNNDSLVKLRI